MKRNRFPEIRRSSWLALAMGLLALAAGSPARADLIVRVQSVTAAIGSAGNGFEVILENTGPDAVSLNGFSFGLEVGPELELLGATTATTAPYIFAGHSLFGPNITLTTGASLLASDAYDNIPGSISLASGATVGLGWVEFGILTDTPGDYSVTLTAFPDTSLSLDGADVPISLLADGTITLVTPEPGSLALALSALGLGVVIRLRARRGAGGSPGSPRGGTR